MMASADSLPSSTLSVNGRSMNMTRLGIRLPNATLSIEKPNTSMTPYVAELLECFPRASGKP